MYQDLIRNELNEAAETLANFLKDDANIHAIQRAAVLLADSFKAGGKVLSCGNGGSHCDAMHFAEELTGRYRENRPGYPAIAISDVSHISCVSNDFGYDYIFSRYVEAVGREGDVLLGISTSGNSGNVIKAIAAAREKRHESDYVDRQRRRQKWRERRILKFAYRTSVMPIVFRKFISK